MSLLGTRVVRVEDPALLTVGGKYVDDLAPADALFATFVRSPMAHAEIGEIDLDDALAVPGVIGVYSAADLGITPQPPSMPMLNQEMLRSRLAQGRVRYVGEPVLVVVSESAASGADAVDRVYVDYEPLPVVVAAKAAASDEVLLFPEVGTNTCFAGPSQAGDDFFDDCEVTVELEFVNQRIAPCPLEVRATVARWDDVDGEPHLTQWSSTQGAHGTRDTLAAATGLDPSQVRVICPDVGGGFGAKNGGYPEDIVVSLLARQLDRPVRWVESRSESMLG
ncbi:MAG: xanthine dehydrogenase family protein molybdopterin-binding subunit, partial [Ilumatobacter sp.]|nr:xanthine dehydrogenase family protein molybdopterin-binding subunit [Ilumatobacter sp.]